MIFYSWSKVWTQSNKRYSNIVLIIDYIAFKSVPWEIGAPTYKYSTIDWSGSSFLLHPKDLIRSSYSGKVTKKEIAQYIWLASLRNYPEYKVTEKLSLDLLACLGKEDIINNNSLLQIVDNQVYFKFEEASRGDLKWL